MPTDRERVNERFRHRKRARQFIELLRTQEDDDIDARESRAPETTPTRVEEVRDEGAILQPENISATEIANPAVRYGDPDRGYGVEYANLY